MNEVVELDDLFEHITQKNQEVYELGKKHGFEEAQSIHNTGMYDEGLNDLWAALNKFYDDIPCKALGVDDLWSAIHKLSAKEFLARVKAYGQDRDSVFAVGDEIITEDGRTGVITRVKANINILSCLDGNGEVFAAFTTKSTKTGRSIPSMVNVLKSIRGEQ